MFGRVFLIYALIIDLIFQKFQKTADSDFVTENDIKNIEKQLKNWIEFLENLKKLNNDVMNIPYSISSEIDLIDTLLSDVS